jgi:NAD(P)-dependent dehydrogenase (short-subunit alcohol dehydrogenase family)
LLGALYGDSGDFNEARWRRVMSPNLDAVFRGCRAVLAPMRRPPYTPSTT